MSAKQIQARFQSLHFEIENLTSANQNLKSQLNDATTLLNTIRHSLGAQPGETALDTVNRVIALYQVRAENAQAEVRKFRDRNEVLGKLVKERSDERDTAWAELKEIRAEAGRAGFVEGYSICWFHHYGRRPKVNDPITEHSADQYAERVKAGTAKG